jgi:hypothetical protein
MRFLKTLTAAAVAISMAGSPVLAQSAAPLSVANSVSRSAAPTQDTNAMRTHDYVSIGVVLLVLLGALLVTELSDPNSP